MEDKSIKPGQKVNRNPTKRKEYWNIIIATFTIISLLIILLTIFYPFNDPQLLAIYIFDLLVTTFLAIDFYLRIRTSPNKLRYVIGHWYELPAMIPLALLGGLDALTVTHNPVLSFKLIAFFRLARLYNLARYIKGNEVFLLTEMNGCNNYFWCNWHLLCGIWQQGCKYYISGRRILVRHREYHDRGIWRILPNHGTRKSDLLSLDVRSNRNSVDTRCVGCVEYHCKKNQGSSGQSARRNQDSNKE